MKTKTKPRGLVLFAAARGMHLAELADKAGIPRGTLYSVSAGNRELSAGNRAKLAKVLRCKPEEIPV